MKKIIGYILMLPFVLLLLGLTSIFFISLISAAYKHCPEFLIIVAIIILGYVGAYLVGDIR